MSSIIRSARNLGAVFWITGMSRAILFARDLLAISLCKSAINSDGFFLWSNASNSIASMLFGIFGTIVIKSFRNDNDQKGEVAQAISQTMVFAILVGILLYYWNSGFLRLIIPNSARLTDIESLRKYQGIILLIPLIYFNFVMNSIVCYYKRYVVASCAPAINASVFVLLLVLVSNLAPHALRLDVIFVASTCLESFFIFYFAKKAGFFEDRKSFFNFSSLNFKKFSGIQLLTLGSIGALVKTNLDSGFLLSLGPGAVSTLALASRVYSGFVGISASVVQSVVFTDMVRLSQGTTKMESMESKSRYLLLFSAMSLVMFAFGLVIPLFINHFQKNSHDLLMMSIVFSVCIPVQIIGDLLAKMTTAEGKYHIIAILSCSQAVTAFICYRFSSISDLGLVAVPFLTLGIGVYTVLALFMFQFSEKIQIGINRFRRSK